MGRWTPLLLNSGISSDGNMVTVEGALNVLGGLSIGLGRGKVIFVDPANGGNSRDGKTPRTAVASLATGYAKLTDAQNDVLVLIGGATSATIADQLIWAKSYTHLVGIAAPTPNSRARITNSGNSTSTYGLLKVTGSGCIFRNIRIYQASATAICYALEVTGHRNYFENVDIQGQAHATAAGGASASLYINAGQENRFVGCTIGLDTVVRTDGSILKFAGPAVRNEFFECFFRSYCQTAAKPMVSLAAAGSLDRSTWFKKCVFYNFYVNHGGKINECFTLPSGMSTADIILQDCVAVGITEWAQGDRGCIWVSGPAPAAGSAGVGSTGIGVQPT